MKQELACIQQQIQTLKPSVNETYASVTVIMLIFVYRLAVTGQCFSTTMYCRLS
jgi:hypothetical protein